MSKRVSYYFIDIESPHIHHFDESSSYTEEYIRQVMDDEEISEIKVFEAVREKGGDTFYCWHYGEAGMKSDSGCGKSCEAYAPRNGKSGNCKHHGPCSTYGDEVVFKREEVAHE